MTDKSLILSLFFMSIGLAFVACSSCQPTVQEQKAKSSQSPSLNAEIDEDEDEDEDNICTKVAQQCRLRPGVLGVCLPGGPANAKRLICTPQH